MAELLEPLRSKYFISGEINSTVDDVEAALARLEARFADGHPLILSVGGGVSPGMPAANIHALSRALAGFRG